MRSYVKFAVIGLALGLALILADMAAGGLLLFGSEEKTCGIYFITALLIASRDTEPLETFFRCLLTAVGMGIVFAVYTIRPDSPAEMLFPVLIWLTSGALGAECSVCRGKYRLRVLSAVIWLLFVASEGLSFMTAYFTLGKGLPLAAADFIGGGVCLWIFMGNKKKQEDSESENLPDYPTDEDGNRLPAGDEQWLL